MLTPVRPTLTHIALHVRDLEASIAFYKQMCAMEVTHERSKHADAASDVEQAERVVWMAERSRQHEMVFVFIPGGPERPTVEGDYSHLGFALPSREAVDDVAERARKLGALRWAPRQEPYPVGYYCGVVDPDGHMLEFSYGQPLGPGAADTP